MDKMEFINSSLTEGKLTRQSQQGNPISAYLFILFKVVFCIIKETSILKVLKLFRRNLSTLLTWMILPFFLKILNLL